VCRRGSRADTPSVRARRALIGSTLAALFVSVLPEVPAAGAGGPVVWVFGGMERIHPTSVPGASTDIAMAAARGEYEPFQIGVRAEGAPLTNVDVAVSDLVGPGGAVILAANLTLYREHFIEVGHHSPYWGGPVEPLKGRWFPDALTPFVDPATGLPPSGGAIPAAPFDVEADHDQPVWVDVLVPRDAIAGGYVGTYTVTSDQGSASGRVDLTVWDFTLPVGPSEDSSFLLQRIENSKQAEELLLRYGIMPDPVTPENQAGFVDAYGLRSADLGFWSGAYYGNCSMDRPPSVGTIRRFVGWQDPRLRLYNYTADEVSGCPSLYGELRAWARNLHEAGVDQLVTMVPVPELFHDGSGTGRTAVDIWVMLPEQLDRVGRASPSLLVRARGKGNDIWSYVALVQGGFQPSWELDYPPADYRILPGFLNQAENVTGVLYWAVDYWSADPWTGNEYRSGRWHYPGEGVLVYPGEPVGVQGVVPSMRLAWIREGIEDYEYVQILRDRGLGAEALSVIEPAAATWRQWTQDSAVIQAVRADLAAAIVASN